MDRHPFDPVSLVFGVVFVAAGLIAVTHGSLWEDGALLVPAGLIGLGVALIVQLARQNGASDQVGAEGSEDGEIEQAGGGHHG